MTGPQTRGGNVGPDGDDIMETAFGFEGPRQLDLGDEDIRLPWLEGDEEEVPRRGPGPKQALLLLLSGILVLCALGAVAWWLFNRQPQSELVADGGLIKAPAGPYKERPSDPGGEFVSGSGDTSYAVAEGQTRTVSIGEGQQDAPPPPLPASPLPTASAPAPEATATAKPVPTEKPSETPALKGPVVQVGAYSTRAAAEQGWVTLSSRSEALAAVSHRIVEGQADIGHVFRLQAVPGGMAAARSLCSELKASGINCQVKP